MFDEDIRTKQDLLFEVSSLNAQLSNEIIKNEELQQRIDKAIEYIESYNLPEDLKGMGEAPITLNDLKILLEILRGKDEK